MFGVSGRSTTREAYEGAMGSEDGVVERYLACLAVHDWDGLAATIDDDDLIREGPYRDVAEGKQPYLKFLRDVFAALTGYRLDVHRISHTTDRLCYVELTETFDIDGVPSECSECPVFELNSISLINRVSVFIKQLAR
jgi:hypothetical protein